MSQKLVLIGGGHSHAIALREWGLNPLPNIDLTLISDVEQTPYSGMLPGHVAGFYTYAETHIDLVGLAEFAGAKFIGDRAIGIDVENNTVICESQQVKYDYLSLDIGSTPQAINVTGAEYTIPAKPVPIFLNAWYELKGMAANTQKDLAIAVVGGGAGGVELALNMQTCLKEILGDKQALKIHLIHRGEQLLSGHNDWVSNRLTKIIRQRGIELYLQQEVIEVSADKIICQSGLKIECDRVFWVTQAAAPIWIKESQLKTDERGFILVADTLQSVSHPNVFAAGDIATMINYQRPKAGVFAVRQGQPLFDNWQHIVTGEALEKYTPQDKYLALIGTGDKKAIASLCSRCAGICPPVVLRRSERSSAGKPPRLRCIASWSSFGWRLSLFWKMKDYIDRKFMNQFADI